MLRILAALIFFTRLPFWKVTHVPSEYFKNIVCYWPVVGWLTAGLTVAVLYLSSLILPANMAVILAIVTRLLITGCLHALLCNLFPFPFSFLSPGDTPEDRTSLNRYRK